MLRYATLDRFVEIKLHGMAKAFEEQLSLGHSVELGFEERLGLLGDREAASAPAGGVRRPHLIEIEA